MSTDPADREPADRDPADGGSAWVPDPDPTSSSVPGPASGDVQPGETPPAEDQVSAPQGHDEHGPRVSPWVWIGGVALVAAVVALTFIGYAVGMFD